MAVAQRVQGVKTRVDETARARDILVPFPEHLRKAHVGDAFVRLSSTGPEDAPAVFVLGGISAGRCAAAEDGGWWGDVVGAGGYLDTGRYRVIGADFFPLAPDAAASLSTDDYADVFAHALGAIGVDRLHAFVGASFGGMIGLAFAARHPARLDRLVTACAAHRAAPMATAWRRTQRRIVEFALKAGDPAEGVAIARELAMTTYRTAEEFNTRFSVSENLEAYLDNRGRDFAARMGAARYLTLSAAIDSHAIAPGEVSTPTLVIAASSDRLVPIDDARALASALPKGRLFEFPSLYGHDSFLKNAADFGPALNAFLEETI